MKMKSLMLAAIAAFGLTSAAQAGYGPVEPIDITVAQNQPIGLYFPNEFDLFKEKLITFDALLTNPSEIDGTLAVYFDWLGLDGLEHFTPVVEFPVAGLSSVDVTHSETLPFCPPQVSLHFRLADAPLMEVHGTFTHECQCVPEPASVVTAGLGVGGLGLAAWRRRRRA